MPLIDRDFDLRVQGRCVAFLALVLRYVRGWLFATHGRTYRKRSIQWSVNVGLPTDSFDDTKLTETFLHIARCAWRCSVLPGPISMGRCMTSLSADEAPAQDVPSEVSGRLLAHDRINAFPEFAAHLAGYLQSPRHQEDLHAMIDVGGGTLDVTVFNVYRRDEGDAFPVFARAVKPLGTRYLVRHRCRNLASDKELRFSPFTDLPGDAEFARLCGVTAEELAEVDASFRNAIGRCIRDALMHTKRKRYPMSPRWEEGLPTFFCGGGAASEFYSALLSGFQHTQPPFRLRYSELPEPDDLDAPRIREGAFQRYAIAYGLSFDAFNIGEIRRMNDVPDADEPGRDSDYREQFVSKDMM